LRRRRLRLRHYSRERDQQSDRDVSPQRLVHYRDNWYLDAWCHTRKALRSFSLDGVREAQLLEQSAHELSNDVLAAELGAGYGIFAGCETELARLRFSRLRARWVASETWHPQQNGRYDDEGRYVLEFPFSDNRELLMDVLKHGPEVEVLAPNELREAVVKALRKTLESYQ
jgi:predicted DNA-binding transcriptional regulator YafY